MKITKHVFTVEGLNLERFVRKAGERGIQLVGMRRTGRKLTALAEEDLLEAISDIAQQGGWHFTTGDKLGLGRYIQAAKQRWMLLLAALACVIMLLIALQLVWCVEVTGEAIYTADARRYLEESGIRSFVWKSSIDLAELRDALEWRYPDIAWADCGWRGTMLRIELVQGVPQGVTMTHIGSGDVVAARGGIVESIVVLAGTAQVQQGDVIHAGQLLISGEERGAGDTTHPVMARGKVIARVWDRASIRMSLTELQTAYTGRQQETWSVICPWFSLGRAEESPYEELDVSKTQMTLGGWFWPFMLQKETYFEAERIRRTRTMAEVEEEAGAAALRLLDRKIGIHDELVDKWVDCCMIEDEVVEAVAYGERLMDVAEPMRRLP